MREAINALSTHLRGVSEELSTERAARQKERDTGISVTRLHFPVTLLFLVLAPLVSIGIGAGVFWRDAREHMADRDIHGDKVQALSKGGIAYTRDVENKIRDKAADLEAADLRLSRAIHQAHCTTPSPGKKGGTTCTFPDANTLPLRP